MTRHYTKHAVRSVAGEKGGATHSAEMAVKSSVVPPDGIEDERGTESADWHLPTLSEDCAAQCEERLDMLSESMGDLKKRMFGYDRQADELEEAMGRAVMLAAAAFAISIMAFSLALIAVIS